MKLVRIFSVIIFTIGIVYGLQAQIPTFDSKVYNAFSTTGSTENPCLNLVDIDGDGDLDFFVGKDFQENIGDAENPAFAPLVEDPFNLPFDGDFMDFGDLDGDGDMDILQIAYTSSAYIYSLAENIGTPTQPQFDNWVELLNVQSLRSKITLNDIDTDGDLDIISSYGSWDSDFDIGYTYIFYYTNQGTSTNFLFENTALNNEVQLSNYSAQFDMADGNGNGLSDFFLMAQGPDEYSVDPLSFLFGLNDNQSFDFVSMDAANVGDHNWLDVELGDIDNDGDADLFGTKDGQIIFQENTTLNNTIFKPTAFDVIINASINEPYPFSTCDFPIVDTEGNNLEKIKITTLPSAGFLELNGNIVSLNQEIPVSEFNAFFFIPGNQVSIPYDSFEFQVFNGSDYSLLSYIATVNVCGLEVEFIQNNNMHQVVVSNGSAPYQYEWLQVEESTALIFTLLDGEYFLTVTDNDGCQLSSSYSVGSDSQGACVMNLTLNTQEEINKFPIDFPNCTQILGDFTIRTDPFTNDPISNLSPLSQLTSVNNLIIQNNDSLINLNGLENLAEINGSLIIDHNYSLENINALNSPAIDGNLLIEFNYSLLNLNGLNNINAINQNVRIIENDQLINLAGLENLTMIGGHLDIIANAELVNLVGLENLTSIEGGLKIGDAYQNLNGGFGWSPAPIHTLGNPSLINLNGLDNLNSIGSHLFIKDNAVLITLSALSNLETVGGTISIGAVTRETYSDSSWTYYDHHTGNPLLENLNGLEGLTSINGNLNIKGNQSLSSLEGLNNVSSIYGALYIYASPSLLNLNDLNNLTSAGGLQIGGSFNGGSSNNGLQSLAGLENLTSLISLNLTGNNSLSFCSIPLVCNHIITGGSVVLYSNANGCNNEDQILMSCPEVSRINFEVYYDLNQNGLKDFEEPGLPNMVLDIMPNALFFYPIANDGTGTGYFINGDYIVNFNETSNAPWEVTSTPSPFEISIDYLNPQADVIFGVYPTEQISKIVSSINAPNTRCNESIIFDIHTKNIGTTLTNGTMWLEVDENITATDFIDTPDSIVLPNKYAWNFDSLYPGQNISKQINLGIPGPDEFTLGDYLNFTSYTNFEDINGEQTSTSFNYAAEVQCSFDPNDKLVNPNRQGNYTLFEEDLTYTIRFQNTGNAEAYDVKIVDQLDANLDWSTFTLLSTSHPEILSTSMTENGLLTFQFTDIFLPDSTTNFEGSQGYVSYRISPLGLLGENTPIENTADIYFDLNPPIITNTTENLMVSEIPSNTAPSSSNVLINMDQNTSYNFSINDFPFTDINEDDIAGIRINTLPSNGLLELDGSTVNVNQEILAANISMLQFIPTTGESGTPYTTFDFSVFDGIAYSESYTTTINVLLVNGIKDQLADFQVQLSPNPTNGILNITINWEKQIQVFTIELLDIYGRTITKQEEQNKGLNYNKTFDFTHLSAGMYFLRVQEDGKRSMQKFIIQ